MTRLAYLIRSLRTICLAMLGIMLLTVGIGYAETTDSITDSIPDCKPDSNGIRAMLRTGGKNNKFTRVVPFYDRVFVANDSVLQTYLFQVPDTLHVESPLRKYEWGDFIRLVAIDSMPAKIEDIAVSDHFIYVALGEMGIRIYRYRTYVDPTSQLVKTERIAITEIARIEDYPTYGVAIPENYTGNDFNYKVVNTPFIGLQFAYYDHTTQSDGSSFRYYPRLYAVGPNGMRIFDFWQDGIVRFSHDLQAKGSNYKVFVNRTQDRAFIVDSTWGIRIVDCENPASPIQIGMLRTPTIPRDIIVRDTIAYVLDSDFGFRTYSIRNTYAPTELGYCDLNGEAENFVMLDSVAFVACSNGGGVRAVSITDPKYPHEIGYYVTPGQTRDLTMIPLYNRLVMLVAESKYLSVYNYFDLESRIYASVPILAPIAAYSSVVIYESYTGVTRSPKSRGHTNPIPVGTKQAGPSDQNNLYLNGAIPTAVVPRQGSNLYAHDSTRADTATGSDIKSHGIPTVQRNRHTIGGTGTQPDTLPNTTTPAIRTRQTTSTEFIQPHNSSNPAKPNNPGIPTEQRNRERVKNPAVSQPNDVAPVETTKPATPETTIPTTKKTEQPPTQSSKSVTVNNAVPSVPPVNTPAAEPQPLVPTTETPTVGTKAIAPVPAQTLQQDEPDSVTDIPAATTASSSDTTGTHAPVRSK